MKRNKKINQDDIFTQRNLDLVNSYLRQTDQMTNKQARALVAKDFPPNHVWFNSAPISIHRDLRGKLVLLDFWTYCCINCMHVLPDLEFLQTKFQGENSIVFIGSHSAKFINEKGPDKVRDAILKYDIKHPVINDDKMLVWRNFERRSWPSLVVLSP